MSFLSYHQIKGNAASAEIAIIDNRKEKSMFPFSVREKINNWMILKLKWFGFKVLTCDQPASLV